jgi:hypothetical protein
MPIVSGTSLLIKEMLGFGFFFWLAQSPDNRRLRSSEDTWPDQSKDKVVHFSPLAVI